jgi:hypothetical protein
MQPSMLAAQIILGQKKILDENLFIPAVSNDTLPTSDKYQFELL